MTDRGRLRALRGLGTDQAEERGPVPAAGAAVIMKATGPGYQQLNYVDGPINIYHDHLVVDQDGRRRKKS